MQSYLLIIYSQCRLEKVTSDFSKRCLESGVGSVVCRRPLPTNKSIQSLVTDKVTALALITSLTGP